MNLVQRVEYWGDHHHPKWIDILRICFGIFLFFKGIQLMYHIDDLQQLVSNKLSYGSFKLALLSHYIIFAHIVGGLFLAAGLLTRIACMVQIPIVLGAVFFIDIPGNASTPVSEFLLAIVVLLLLVYFMVVGSGPWSVNRFIDQENSMHVNK